MVFTLDKCKVMDFGKLKQLKITTVNGRGQGIIVEQRDLVIQEYSSLKVATQVDKVVKKTHGMFAFINWGNENKCWDSMLQPYMTFMRLYLEYCVQFWSSHSKKDVIKLERMQEQFTKIQLGLEGSSI